MKNWSDDDILDYLMTSDFNENLSPEELKFLLLKFKQFYRVNANRFTNIELERKKYLSDLENLKLENLKNVGEHEIRYEKLNNKFDYLLNRKLTLRERITGKIISKNNENL